MERQLGRLLADAYTHLRQEDQSWRDLTRLVTPPVVDPQMIQVTQLHAWVPTSCCMLTETSGTNHCQHPPPPRIPWPRRAGWRMSGWWRRGRIRVGSWIAGVDLDRDEG